jgi:hypothetical protein
VSLFVLQLITNYSLTIAALYAAAMYSSYARSMVFTIVGVLFVALCFATLKYRVIIRFTFAYLNYITFVEKFIQQIYTAKVHIKQTRLLSEPVRCVLF